MGHFVVVIEERDKLSDGSVAGGWGDGIGGCLVEAGCAFGVGGCGSVSLLKELQVGECLLVCLEACIAQ